MSSEATNRWYPPKWWRAGETLALSVPSAPVAEEANILLNPGHPAIRRVQVVADRPFVFDPRLIE